MSLYEEGLLHREIAERIGCAVSTVTNHLNRMGAYRYGRNQREKVLELHNQGMYDIEIAEKLGICRSDVTMLLNKQGITDRRSKQDDIPLRDRISQSLIGKYNGTKNPNYKGSTNLKTLARGISKTISKRIIRKRGCKCEICGNDNTNLETHHIKPFKLILDDFINNVYDGNIETFYEQITQYEDFMNEDNMVIVCHDCHKKIHYSDNHELSPYRWESAKTIEKAV